MKPKRPSVRCSDCPKQCFCGIVEDLQKNHLGGWRHVPWLFYPFCKADHTQFHVNCRRAGVDFSHTPNKSLGLIQALKAMLVGMWMVLESFEKHARTQSEQPADDNRSEREQNRKTQAEIESQ
jgi:hypothetical protein